MIPSPDQFIRDQAAHLAEIEELDRREVCRTVRGLLIGGLISAAFWAWVIWLCCRG